MREDPSSRHITGILLKPAQGEYLCVCILQLLSCAAQEAGQLREQVQVLEATSAQLAADLEARTTELAEVADQLMLLTEAAALKESQLHQVRRSHALPSITRA